LELSRVSGLLPGEVATRWRQSGLADEWDTGLLTLKQFAAKVSQLMQAPDLTAQVLGSAWLSAVGTLDPTLAPLAARLSQRGQLILASNNNPVHWPAARAILTDAGIAQDTPAVLSHEVGARKPAQPFFAALLATAAGRDLLFVDDQDRNVQGAARCGINTLQHRDPAETLEIVTSISGAREAT
jgi:HAD superfamily hydrolase (TIGR01509 family)